MARVVETIRREAARYGVAIHHSELVGLIPQEALVDAAQWYLQLDQFEPDQILEYRLVSAQQEARMQACENFLDELASNKPVPAGGSAVAFSGAAGAALVAMAARLTIGKKQYTAVEAQMQDMLRRAERLQKELREAIQKDADSFMAVITAKQLPKDTPEKEAIWQKAVKETTLAASQVPLETARMAVEVMEVALQAISLGNSNTISDSATGAALARAALTGAGYNVRINLASLSDRSLGKPLLAELDELERRAQALEIQIRTHLVERGGLSFA
jgi:glutamate formiminotransferase/formiminotetrahydrofolate cyclodeaminase